MFKITIEETKTVVKKVGKEWNRIIKLDEKTGQRYEDTGYTPEIEKHVEVTMRIYEQQVAELDLPSVIAAVNKMGAK